MCASLALPASALAQAAPDDSEGPLGICLGVAGSCAPDDSCQAGGECIGGLCVKRGAACRDAVECAATGQCIAIANTCSDDAQCEDGYACQLGLCVMVLDAAACDPTHEECASEADPCAHDEECTGACDGGACETSEPADVPVCEGRTCAVLEDSRNAQPDESDGPPDDSKEALAPDSVASTRRGAHGCSLERGASSPELGAGLGFALSLLLTRRKRT